MATITPTPDGVAGNTYSHLKASIDANLTSINNELISLPGDLTPLMDGVAAVGVSAQLAHEDHVHPTDTSRAPVDSPTFIGDPKAPTPAVDDNDTSIATTAWVLSQASVSNPLMDGAVGQGTSTRWSRSDHRHPSDSAKANLADPTFTGTLSAGALTTTGNINLSGGSAIINLGTPTTGTISIGGTSQTGTITLGKSTETHTVDIATGNHLSGRTKTINIGTGGASGSSAAITVGSATGTCAVTISGASAIMNAPLTTNYDVTMGGSNNALNIGNSLITGSVVIGGVSQTGAITVGRSTDNCILNVASGATASGKVKEINLGTGGVSGSTTNITIGSAVAGAASNLAINSTWLSLPYSTVIRKETANSSEGGQFALEKPDTGTTLLGNVNIDVNGDLLRFWDGVGTTGAHIKLKRGAAGATSELAFTSDLTPLAPLADPTFTGTVTAAALTASGGINFTTAGGAINLGSSLTTGSITFGGLNQTGPLTLGRSTDTHTLNLDAQATASGKTKTLNIGTGGLAGSGTVITIGSAAAGNTTNVAMRGTVTVSGSLLVDTTTGAFGFATGSGGTVTQAATSGKATAVALNKLCGRITMNNASLAAGAQVVFWHNNSLAGANDNVIANIHAGSVAAISAYTLGAFPYDGGNILYCLKNVSGSPLSEAVAINFTVIKGVNS